MFFELNNVFKLLNCKTATFRILYWKCMLFPKFCLNHIFLLKEQAATSVMKHSWGQIHMDASHHSDTSVK